VFFSISGFNESITLAQQQGDKARSEIRSRIEQFLYDAQDISPGTERTG
jgi:hypothetical protein